MSESKTAAKAALLRLGKDSIFNKRLECACHPSDLFPCGALQCDCITGYDHEHISQSEVVVKRQKEPCTFCANFNLCDDYDDYGDSTKLQTCEFWEKRQ